MISYNTSTDSCKVGCTDASCGHTQCYSLNRTYARYYGGCVYECTNNYTDCSVTIKYNCTYTYSSSGNYHITYNVPD